MRGLLSKLWEECVTITLSNSQNCKFKATPGLLCGSTVASWLVRSPPDRVARDRALARDIVLCSWARQFTFKVPLSTQVDKWVLANLMLGIYPVMDQYPIQVRVEFFLAAS